MAIASQLSSIAICLLILGSVSVLGFESKPKQSSVSYTTTPATTPLNDITRKAIIEPSRHEDLAVSATTASSLVSGHMKPQTQPNIYHSFIDRTSASDRYHVPVQTQIEPIGGDLITAAGHHHGHAHGKYYEYRAVPKKKTWKFGYKRGNHKHTIMRHEHGKAGKHPHFKTKVKWHDKKSKGKGIHLWDYNHHDKKHYHHG